MAPTVIPIYLFVATHKWAILSTSRYTVACHGNWFFPASILPLKSSPIFPHSPIRKKVANFFQSGLDKAWYSRRVNRPNYLRLPPKLSKMIFMCVWKNPKPLFSRSCDSCFLRLTNFRNFCMKGHCRVWSNYLPTVI